MSGATWRRSRVAQSATILGLEATRGRMLPMGVGILIVAALLATTVDSGDFLPGFADPLNYGLSASMFICTIVAGVSAVVTREVSAGRPVPQLAMAASMWGHVRVLVARIAAVAVWGLIGQIIITVTVLAVSNLAGARTVKMAALPLLSIGCIIGSAVIGACAALLWDSLLVAPIVMGTFFSIAVTLPRSNWVRYSPFQPGLRYQVYLEPSLTWTVCILGEVAAVAAVLVGVSMGLRRIVLVAAPFLAAFVALASHVSGPVAVRSGGEGLCATKGEVELCVWPEDRAQLARVLPALSSVHDVAAAYWRPTRAYHEPGVLSQRGSVELRLTGSDEPFDVGSAIVAVVPASCSPETEASRVELIQFLAELMVPGLAPPDSMAARMASQGQRQQSGWVRTRIGLLGGCQ